MKQVVLQFSNDVEEMLDTEDNIEVRKDYLNQIRERAVKALNERGYIV